MFGDFNDVSDNPTPASASVPATTVTGTASADSSPIPKRTSSIPAVAPPLAWTLNGAHAPSASILPAPAKASPKKTLAAPSPAVAETAVPLKFKAKPASARALAPMDVDSPPVPLPVTTPVKPKPVAKAVAKPKPVAEAVDMDTTVTPVAAKPKPVAKAKSVPVAAPEPAKKRKPVSEPDTDDDKPVEPKPTKARKLVAAHAPSTAWPPSKERMEFVRDGLVLAQTVTPSPAEIFALANEAKTPADLPKILKPNQMKDLALVWCALSGESKVYDAVRTRTALVDLMGVIPEDKLPSVMASLSQYLKH